jgi:hypothetical protein
MQRKVLIFSKFTLVLFITKTQTFSHWNSLQQKMHWVFTGKAYSKMQENVYIIVVCSKNTSNISFIDVVYFKNATCVCHWQCLQWKHKRNSYIDVVYYKNKKVLHRRSLQQKRKQWLSFTYLGSLVYTITK